MKFRRLICRGKGYELPVLLSPEDIRWARAQGNWFVTHGAKTATGEDTSGYAVRSVGKGLVWLHKEVLRRAGKIPPTPDHIIGDHLNGGRRDNRRGNLRWATVEMNNRNRHGAAWRQFELDIDPKELPWNISTSSKKLLSSSDLEAFISRQKCIVAETVYMQATLEDLFGCTVAVAHLSPASAGPTSSFPAPAA